jgi:uncharacterized protein
MADSETYLARIATALERLAPAPPAIPDLSTVPAWVWDGARSSVRPVHHVQHVPLDALLGIDQQKSIIFSNCRQFALGHPANNMLLWGARGMGKSSLVKAVHAALVADGLPLVLVEIHREDIETLPTLLSVLAGQTGRFLLYCDDLSFEAADTRYKALKAVLEGGLEGRPEHVLFAATSNRRHLMPRELWENEANTAINARDVVDDKVALSDRFGLWIGFHVCDQATYLAMVSGYAARLGLDITADALRAQALEWATTRGARSGRVAYQFSLDLAGRLRSAAR